MTTSNGHEVDTRFFLTFANPTSSRYLRFLTTSVRRAGDAQMGSVPWQNTPCFRGWQLSHSLALGLAGRTSPPNLNFLIWKVWVMIPLGAVRTLNGLQHCVVFGECFAVTNALCREGGPVACPGMRWTLHPSQHHLILPCVAFLTPLSSSAPLGQPPQSRPPFWARAIDENVFFPCHCA